jgi:hypothetical protein
LRLKKLTCLQLIFCLVFPAIIFAYPNITNPKPVLLPAIAIPFSCNNEFPSSIRKEFVSNPGDAAPSSIVNLPPISKAGNDTTIELPNDFITLNGCMSFDPEQAVLRYNWVKVSGPGAYLLPIDSLCSVNVKGLIEGVYSFELTVIDTAGLTGKDTIAIIVNSIFSTNWPTPATLLCDKPFKIVVLGSSTAFGTGADPIDSSWVKKLTTYLLQQAAPVTVVNLANLGYTTYDISPTGVIVPPAWPITVDSL